MEKSEKPEASIHKNPVLEWVTLTLNERGAKSLRHALRSLDLKQFSHTDAQFIMGVLARLEYVLNE